MSDVPENPLERDPEAQGDGSSEQEAEGTDLGTGTTTGGGKDTGDSYGERDEAEGGRA